MLSQGFKNGEKSIPWTFFQTLIISIQDQIDPQDSILLTRIVSSALFFFFLRFICRPSSHDPPLLGATSTHRTTTMSSTALLRNKVKGSHTIEFFFKKKRDLIIINDKVYPSAKEAVADIRSGSKLLVGGFGLCGIPENLISVRFALIIQLKSARPSKIVAQRTSQWWVTIVASMILGWASCWKRARHVYRKRNLKRYSSDSFFINQPDQENDLFICWWERHLWEAISQRWTWTRTHSASAWDSLISTFTQKKKEVTTSREL